jgi:Dolichyl-phosphate-mannose-protein mannosyltransferase
MPSKPKKRRDAFPNPARPAAQPAAPQKPPLEVLPFLERHSRVLIAALILLGTIRIVATYTVFSHTFDEPAHLACGMEWLDKGVYRWEPQHPPLARVAAALGPYLAGVRSQNTPNRDIYSMTFEGLAILFSGQGHSGQGQSGQTYDRTLALARLGILPFFWIGCLVIYWWAKRYITKAAAVIAVFLLSFLPPILAHAGLATTDMACTAFLAAAFLAATVWIEGPTPRTGAIFGLAAGLAIVSKFSTLPYFAAAAAIALIWYYFAERLSPAGVVDQVRRRLPSLALAAAVAFLVIWATYRFSFGKVFFANISLPFPELYAGIRDVFQHNAEGHPGYLLGTRSNHGYWYFYLVDLAVKTPLALMVLFALGLSPSLRKGSKFVRPWLPVAFCAGILTVALFSHINIGIRHVLPIYAGFVLVAAVGAVRLIELAPARRWAGWLAILLFVWYSASSLWSHPDYLPYFNALAGSHPENIVVDSDLDWGQDMKRLAARLRAAGAPEVYFLPMDTVAAERGDFEKGLGFPHVISEINALAPSAGWNAVSLTCLKQRRLGLRDRRPDLQPWPDRILHTGELIGKSVRLWYFPPRAAAPDP